MCAPETDEYPIKNHHDIAEALGYKVPRVCKLLKDLYSDLIKDFMVNPIIIKDYVHAINISYPWDEQKSLERKNKNHPYIDEYTWIEMKLPFTPRIGEEIRFDFVQMKRFKRGYVHSIEHELDGKTQRIYIQVHPTNHEYYRWKKLEDDYERWERWRRYQERQKQ